MNNNQEIIPSIINFFSSLTKETFAKFFLVISTVNLFLSYFKKLKIHSLRLSGILYIMALILYFSNGWVTIFGIIIISTLITKLNFIETIVGLIFKNENFFKYRYFRNKRKEFYESNEDNLAKKMQDSLSNGVLGKLENQSE